jgi:O-acetyl-ADP-ribose deacetylase (regulator of RNase III)
MSNLKFIFFDINKEIIDAYEEELSKLKEPDSRETQLDISFVNDSLKNVVINHKIDCIVSPANSFGYMDNGIDYYISEMFPNIENIVRKVIDKNTIYRAYSTNIPVNPIGYSIMTNTTIEGETNDYPYCKYLISAPTMFNPGEITGTNNVYRAFSSILDNLGDFPIDKTMKVAVPGLGTGFGRMTGSQSAKQVYLAFKHYQERKDYLM